MHPWDGNVKTGWTEAEDSLKMSHTPKTPGSERVYGVKGPSLLPSLCTSLYTACWHYCQHRVLALFTQDLMLEKNSGRVQELSSGHTSFEDLKTTGRYWWTLGESSGQKVQSACHTICSIYILYRLYILYIEYVIFSYISYRNSRAGVSVNNCASQLRRATRSVPTSGVPTLGSAFDWLTLSCFCCSS